MTQTTIAVDERYQQALAALNHAFDKYHGCTEEEKQQLRADLAELRDMERKLTQGRVEIVLFGEISTGKSALINALTGRNLADVNVQGGWTKETRSLPWATDEYVVKGLDESSLVLVDTPGLNEVGDFNHEAIARAAVRRGDLILFVTDSDLNEVEYSSIVALLSVSKPLLVVLNKIDLYPREELERLTQVLRDERLKGLVPPENIVLTAADPREVEYIEVGRDGRERSWWRKPESQVEDLKARILQLLARDGLDLLALNAAMYAADTSDRIARLRIQLRQRRAGQAIGSFAALKAIAVAINPIAVADVLGGTAVDVSMVVTLAHIYGLPMSWMHARRLVRSIVKAAGWVMVGEIVTHGIAVLLKGITLGAATVLTLLPQGAAAGYASYIVGHAAKYYLEHGASWGSEGPKTVVRRILADTDKQSVIQQLKDEISKKLGLGLHRASSGGRSPKH